MELSEHLNDFVTRMQFVKEALAKVNGAGDEADIYTYVEVWRDDAMQITVGMQPDRDAMVTAMATMYAGTHPDFLLVVHEAYMTEEAKNPVTGEEWEHLDMGWVHQEAPSKVKPALNFIAFNAQGDIQMRLLSYEVDEKNEMTWDEPFATQMEDAELGGGVVYDSIQRILKIPPMLEELRRAGDAPDILKDWLVEDPDPEIKERRDYHMDMASLRAVAAHVKDLFVGGMLHAEKGSVREQCLKEFKAEGTGMKLWDLGMKGSDDE